MGEFEKVLEAYNKFEQTVHREATDTEKRLIRFGYVTALTDVAGKEVVEKLMFGTTQ
jgi:predicted metal-binding protein